VTAPNSGRDLSAPYTPVQWILGPWGWMIIVFEHHPDTDVVYVLAIEDGRSSTAVTGIS
jgi:hypothetical protein